MYVLKSTIMRDIYAWMYMCVNVIIITCACIIYIYIYIYIHTSYIHTYVHMHVNAWDPSPTTPPEIVDNCNWQIMCCRALQCFSF